MDDNCTDCHVLFDNTCITVFRRITNLYAVCECVMLNPGKESIVNTFAALQFTCVSFIITSVAVFLGSGLSRCSAVGSAPALGAGCREFESLHLDHNFFRSV